MFQQMKKRIKNEKGLTLIELLAVIVILAIVAAIAIPAIGNIINNFRDKGQISDALNIISGAKLAHIENGCGTEAAGCTKDKLAGFVDGVDLPANIKVTLNSTSKVWEITGYDFKIKDTTKFNVANGAAATNSETTLKSAVDQ